ncbi:MAG: hypothetical protein RLZZ164_146 [Actinomycetota bacterium]|jgi:heavy metal translocating P-type ATPase
MFTLWQWQTERVGMNFVKRYWFLTISILGLAVGLATRDLTSKISFGAVAAVGLVLAASWTYSAIKNKELGSDSLAILAIVASVMIGEWLAAAIISVMLASGRALEEWAEGNARRELHSLLSRAPVTATVVIDGSETTVPIAEVAIGTLVKVVNGQVVPLDGILLDDAVLDESALTGESLPIARESGDQVASGVLNGGATFVIRTTSDYQNSTYANLVRLVQQATTDSASSVRLANRWAVWFIPLALVIALATWAISGQASFAVAVLVAATPCPLILAVPVALISGMSRASKHGVIIKGGAILEQLARIKAILFDKTGTLTHGGMRIGAVAFAPNADQAWVMSAAASVERHSPHVVAKAVVDAAAAYNGYELLATEVSETHGLGITGVVDGRRVRVGQPSGEIASWARLQEALLVAVEIDGELQAMIGLDDPIREDTLATTDALRQLKVNQLVLVSGDRLEAAEKVANQIAASEVYAQCTPERKLEVLREKQDENEGHVAAVGDGINDAPLLAGANVGIAMGARGSTAASEAADVVIVEDSIYRVAVAIDIAKGSFNKALQAAGVGMGLALVAMFAGAFGVLSPTASALAQEAIDTCAVLWAITPIRSYIVRGKAK